MATKTISIGEDAYELLASNKKKSESFTEVIKRLTKKHSLMELAGILTDKEAEDLKQHIKERRKTMRSRITKITEALSQ